MHWPPITCESRMGELAGGFHPGGITAPLPASAGGCRVVVPFLLSEDWIPVHRHLVSKMPPSQLPGFCSRPTEVVRFQSGFDFTKPEGFASSRPVSDFHNHTEVLSFLSNGSRSVFVELTEVCSPIRFPTVEVRL